MTQKYYAHSKDGCPPEEWQQLAEHLENVTETAREFTSVFEDWGYLAGLCHGKNNV